VGASRSFVAEAAEVVVLALGLYLVITFAIQTVHVIGLSMYPSLDDNDYLIANKLDYRLHAPQRGDIIIMRDPFDSSKDFIKRVVALPGEELLIKDAHVYINGHLLTEPYLRTDEPWNNNANWPPPGAPDAGQARTMPPNQYFVMGDNRNASSDSRVFGWVARDRIEARAWLRIWPLAKMGPIDQVKPTVATSSSLSVAA
jgi:signal peptidase I